MVNPGSIHPQPILIGTSLIVLSDPPGSSDQCPGRSPASSVTQRWPAAAPVQLWKVAGF